MNGGGKEYALALFSIMVENGNPEEIYSDIELVGQVFSSNQEYIEFLVNPSIPKSERLEDMRRLFEGRLSETVFSFLNVIFEHRDMYVLLSAIDEFKSMYENYMNIADAIVTSAVELTDEQKQRLITKLEGVTGKTIRAEYIVDKSIIGGISISVDGKNYDGSVRKNLKNLKEVMS